MSTLARLCARRKWTWRTWLLLMTPFFAISLPVYALWSCLLHLYQEWHHQWRYDFREWALYFTEKHRARVRSLALRPEAHVVHWRKR